MSLLLQCGQTIPLFSCSASVRIFENSFLQARQRKLYWGMFPPHRKPLFTKILDARPAGVNWHPSVESGRDDGRQSESAFPQQYKRLRLRWAGAMAAPRIHFWHGEARPVHPEFAFL